MRTSENSGIRIPEEDDYYNINVYGEAIDKIDDVMHDNAVAAEEAKGAADTALNRVGLLSGLLTNNKTNVVAAINEVVGRITGLDCSVGRIAIGKLRIYYGAIVKRFSQATEAVEIAEEMASVLKVVCAVDGAPKKDGNDKEYKAEISNVVYAEGRTVIVFDTTGLELRTPVYDGILYWIALGMVE